MMTWIEHPLPEKARFSWVETLFEPERDVFIGISLAL